MRNAILALIFTTMPATAHTWVTSICDALRVAGHPTPPQCVADLRALALAGLTSMEFEPDDDGRAFRRAERMRLKGPFEAEYVTLRGRRYLIVTGPGDQETSVRAYDDRGRVVASDRGLGVATDGKRLVVILRKGFRRFLP